MLTPNAVGRFDNDIRLQDNLVSVLLLVFRTLARFTRLGLHILTI